MQEHRSSDALYPLIEPYATGMLDVGAGQQIYWEECGNPSGKPAVFLHGGLAECPARGPAAVRPSPLSHRALRSTRPAEPAARQRTGADLSANTTWHLVADIERLREHRGIERWQVFGGSWGRCQAWRTPKSTVTVSRSLCCEESSRPAAASSTSTTTAAPGSCFRRRGGVPRSAGRSLLCRGRHLRLPRPAVRP